MGKKQARHADSIEIDRKILFRWVAREAYDRARPIVETLTDAWFAAEVERRLGKPPRNEDGFRYYYTRHVEDPRSAGRNEGEGIYRISTNRDGIRSEYETSDSPEYHEKCPNCGDLHPVIMEYRLSFGPVVPDGGPSKQEHKRLFVICHASPEPRVITVFDTGNDDESELKSDWSNGSVTFKDGKIIKKEDAFRTFLQDLL